MKKNIDNLFIIIVSYISILYFFATSFDFYLKDFNPQDVIFNWITVYFIVSLFLIVGYILYIKRKISFDLNFVKEKDFFFIGLTIFMGVLLHKFSYIDHVSMWGDEFTDILLSGNKAAYDACLLQNQPPLFCVVNSSVQFIYGASEIPLRIAMSLISSLACFLFFLISYKFSKNFIFALILCAFYLFTNPMIQYGYEVRPYVLGIFHSILFCYFLLRALNKEVENKNITHIFLGISTYLFLNSIGMQSALFVGSITLSILVLDSYLRKIDYNLIFSLVLPVIIYLPIQIIILIWGANPHEVPGRELINTDTLLKLVSSIKLNFIRDFGIYAYALVLILLAHLIYVFKSKKYKETRLINIMLLALILFYFKGTALFDLFIPLTHFKKKYTVAIWPIAFLIISFMFGYYKNKIQKFWWEKLLIISIAGLCIIQLMYFDHPIYRRRNYRAIFKEINQVTISKDRLITICLTKRYLCNNWNYEKLSGNVYYKKTDYVPFETGNTKSIKNVFLTFKNYKKINKLIVMVHGVRDQSIDRQYILSLLSKTGEIIYDEDDTLLLVIENQNKLSRFYDLIKEVIMKNSENYNFMLEELLAQYFALIGDNSGFNAKKNELLLKARTINYTNINSLESNLEYYENRMREY